jgi:hypothetical protein
MKVGKAAARLRPSNPGIIRSKEYVTWEAM